MKLATLAQAGGDSQGDALLWVGILLGATLFGCVIVLYVRSRYLGQRDDDATPASLMAEMRRMRDAGEISEQEFDRTRRLLVSRAAGDPPPQPHAARDEDAAVIARPGYDLTGAPLPGAGEPGPGGSPGSGGRSPETEQP